MGNDEVPKPKIACVLSRIAAYRRHRTGLKEEPKYYSMGELKTIRKGLADKVIRDVFGEPCSVNQLTVTELLAELARRLEMLE